jgi:hypothetical protein
MTLATARPELQLQYHYIPNGFDDMREILMIMAFACALRSLFLDEECHARGGAG